MATGFKLRKPVAPGQIDVPTTTPGGPNPVESAPVGTIRPPATIVAGTNPVDLERARVASVTPQATTTPGAGFLDRGYGQTGDGQTAQERLAGQPRGSIKLTGGSRNFGVTSGSRTTVSSTILPSGALPTFTAPERDKGRVRALRSKFAASGVRNLRRGLQMALTRQYENPNVRALNVRAALQGFGAGLGDILQKADIQANRQAETEFQTDLLEAQTNFQAALGKYNAGIQRVTTTGAGQVAGAETVFGTPTSDVVSRPGQIDFLNPTVTPGAPPGPRPRVFGGKK